MECSISSCLHWDSHLGQCALGEPDVAVQEKTGHGRPHAESLTLTSLELGKVLAGRDGTTFRAQGYCMYPLIRPGDTLKVDPKTIDEVKIGDIAVCRRKAYLFAHRIIAKNIHDGKPCILTRPDNASHGNDGPTFDSDLLGTVSYIGRHGWRMNPARRNDTPNAKRVNALRLKLIGYKFALRQRILSVVAILQPTPLYRTAVRPFFASKLSKGVLTVLLPFAGKWETGVFQSIPAGEFEFAANSWQGKKIDKWRLALHFNGGTRPAARASFVRRPPTCPFAGWWLEKMQVRVRYRGAGLEEKLIHKAEEILSRGGYILNCEC
jgi:hypothetical protein